MVTVSSLTGAATLTVDPNGDGCADVTMVRDEDGHGGERTFGIFDLPALTTLRDGLTEIIGDGTPTVPVKVGDTVTVTAAHYMTVPFRAVVEEINCAETFGNPELVHPYRVRPISGMHAGSKVKWYAATVVPSNQVPEDDDSEPAPEFEFERQDDAYETTAAAPTPTAPEPAAEVLSPEQVVRGAALVAAVQILGEDTLTDDLVSAADFIVTGTAARTLEATGAGVWDLGGTAADFTTVDEAATFPKSNARRDLNLADSDGDALRVSEIEKDDGSGAQGVYVRTPELGVLLTLPQVAELHKFLGNALRPF